MRVPGWGFKNIVLGKHPILIGPKASLVRQTSITVIVIILTHILDLLDKSSRKHLNQFISLPWEAQ